MTIWPKKITGKKQVIVTLALAVLLSVGFIITPLVRADQFDQQIQSLNQQNTQSQGTVNQLSVQANSYQTAINVLQSQISNIQTAIGVNQAKQAQLQQQIAAAVAELNKEKKVLGEDIKAMYLDGQTSTLEMLASSKDLSDFVNKEEYRSSVSDKLKVTLDTVTALKHQLQGQKEQVDQLVQDQQNQQDQLNATRQQQQQLLSYNQQQQTQYTSQIQANNAQIASLRAQQAIENAKLFRGATVVSGGACDTAHGDTYPVQWCAAPQDSTLDSWGMFNRECVSYTAWKVYESGRHMPYWGGFGNANQWDNNARAAGIPVDTHPRTGDVAIKDSLPFGHSMYVESVNGDGTINISQYNQQLDGRFSRAYNVSPAGLVFIHFQ